MKRKITLMSFLFFMMLYSFGQRKEPEDNRYYEKSRELSQLIILNLSENIPFKEPFFISIRNSLKPKVSSPNLISSPSVIKYKLDYEILQTWDETTSQLVNHSKTYYGYDNNGNLTLYGVSHWEENQWGIGWKIEYAYDTNGNLLQEIQSYWWESQWEELTPNWPYFATAIAVDNENNKWLGLTDSYLGAQTGYLTEFEGEQSNILSSPYLDAPGGQIRSIGICPTGTIWMGTWGNGLIKFDGIDWQVYNTSNSEIPSGHIWNVTVEGADIIWMSTENGLTRFDGVTWKTFNTENSILPSNTINSILIDENGTKWVGTDKGLISFKGNALSTSDEQNSKVQFKLFPNPANDFLTLEISPDAINSTIEVFNVQGKLIKSMKMTNISYKMDISTFSSGMYFIQLKTKNGMAIKKFVKQN